MYVAVEANQTLKDVGVVLLKCIFMWRKASTLSLLRLCTKVVCFRKKVLKKKKLSFFTHGSLVSEAEIQQRHHWSSLITVATAGRSSNSSDVGTSFRRSRIWLPFEQLPNPNSSSSISHSSGFVSDSRGFILHLFRLTQHFKLIWKVRNNALALSPAGCCYVDTWLNNVGWLERVLFQWWVKAEVT